MTSAADASRRSIAIDRTLRPSNFWVPWRRPPTTNAMPEHEETVGQDRADERRLDDDDQAGLQREDRDEQLGQVPEARLKDPR